MKFCCEMNLIQIFLFSLSSVFFTTLASSTGNEQEVDDSRILSGLFSRYTTPSSILPPYKKTCDCKCGEPKDDTRVIGGEEYGMGEQPWLARIFVKWKYTCGGSLINDRYVLTAAHCVLGTLWFQVQVKLGEDTGCSYSDPPGVETRYVLQITSGKFNLRNKINDVSLLKLNEIVPYTDKIRPICLPKNQFESYEGKTATVAGYGRSSLNDPMRPCKPLKADLPVLSNEDCKKTRVGSRAVLETNLCAGYAEGGIDSCWGDSGGPLIYQNEERKYEIIGIVSWGIGCAEKNSPGLYTRVTSYLGWIIKHASDGCFCTK